MRHLNGPKRRGRHTSVIDSAFDLCQKLMDCPLVDGILFGTITMCQASKPKLKIEPQPTCLRLDIKSPRSAQTIIVYCQSESLSPTKGFIEAEWGQLFPHSNRPSKVKNNPRRKNRQLVRAARLEEKLSLKLERELEREKVAHDEEQEEPASDRHVHALLDYCMVHRYPDPVFRFRRRQRPNGKYMHSCEAILDLPTGQVSSTSGEQRSRIKSQDIACEIILRNLT